MIVWSNRANTSFDKIAENIREQFSQKEEDVFVNQVYEVLATITEYPKAYPECKKPKRARKAVIHPHTTLFYSLKSKKRIDLLFFFDNRTNPKKLK